MTMMQYIKNTILSDESLEKLFSKLMDLENHFWNKFGGKSEDIFKWLHNFSDDEEANASYYYALKLATKISYYTLKDIRYLYGYLLNNKVKTYLIKEILDYEIKDIDKWFQKYLKEKCIFVSFGEAGKSASSMLYKFKQAQKIKDLNYKEPSEFLNVKKKKNSYPDKEYIFLIDDFLGCGNQAYTFWHKKFNNINFNKFSKKNSNLKFIYLALIGCKEGIELLEKKTIVKVIVAETYDDKFKCFSDNSIIYKKVKERVVAENIMKTKGKFLFNKHPLGFNNMQLAIAFEHNTPNNSLPVIWKNKQSEWFPLFERFE